jgi:hypothetical protein
VEEFFFHPNITDNGKKQTKGGWRHLVLLQVTKERKTDQQPEISASYVI